MRYFPGHRAADAHALMSTKRNLIGNFFHCAKTWRALRRHPGLFSLADASMLLSGVVLPMRFGHRAAGRALAREARIEPFEEGVVKVTVVEHGLMFYWLGRVDNNLHYSIDQEFNPNFPHHYTTPPVRLTPESLVFDVGACEGLFAFRVLKERQAAKVICFEPSARTARYTRMAAEVNGVADRMIVETKAVGKTSGPVNFSEDGGSPDGHHIQAGGGGATIECVALDDYCAARGLKLTPRDLIKIDAEGSDFDVLLGAERLIREGSPQISVTTYHKPEHAFEIVEWLKKIQPAYRMRLKGFASWTPQPTPVLLQAAL